jgi:hypothetical protein
MIAQRIEQSGPGRDFELLFGAIDDQRDRNPVGRRECRRGAGLRHMEMLLKYDIVILPLYFCFSIRTVACTIARHYRNRAKLRNSI